MSEKVNIDLGKLTEQEYWSYEIMNARFDLIDELIEIAEPVEQENGRKLFHAVSLIQLENKRREMLTDFNNLQTKAIVKGE